jgi:hypothetical protein
MLRSATTLVPALLLALAHAAFGQSTVGRPVRFGLLAGVNLASLAGSDAEGLDTRTGVILGPTFVLPIAAGVALDIGALFSMKGATSSVPGETAAIQMNYVEAPALLRFDVPAAGDVKPFLSGGAAVSFTLSCDLEGRSGGITVSLTCEDFDDQFGTGATRWQTVDGAAVVGGGLAFDVGGRVMTLATRYTLGLSTISDDDNSKHRVLSFLVTFESPIGR